MSDCEKCSEVGPPLTDCPNEWCARPIAPRGRSVAAEAYDSYCDCEEKCRDAPAEERAQQPFTRASSALWPGERWGDSMPCIHKPKEDSCV